MMTQNDGVSNIVHNLGERPNVLVHVAGNVRRLRMAAQLSQQALAERASVSRRMLVNIEKGDVNVSLNTLDRIAEALGAVFHTIVQPPDQIDTHRIDTLAWAGADPTSRAVLLASLPARTEVELWSWSLAPGERYDSAANPPGWQEMIVVTEGCLSLYLGQAPVRVVDTHDFHVFASDCEHAYVNEGRTTVRFVRNVIY
ncbi:XRE family transcriptional regulator [Salinisphaera sp. T31B1]|uniref:helix-turn-helix domain-containing protein n=1 Tax=Salinisphaera sp. T31B1 TaxID=727963 RepID=UPI003342E10A